MTKDKTLAIIMAAGYGTRMGPMDTPKAMMLDRSGRPFIEDAFTFLRYAGDSIDFAVLSRDEPFFRTLNDYLREHPFAGRFVVLHQNVKPHKFHAMPLFLEYLSRRGKIHDKLGEYGNIVVLPADHKLTADELNLEKLVEAHQQNGANITLVFSEGWYENLPYGEIIKADENGKVTYIKRDYKKRTDSVNHGAKRDFIKVTNTGVLVIRKNVFDNPMRLVAAYGGFRIGLGLTAEIASSFAYMIEPGWAGLRDTPLDIKN